MPNIRHQLLIDAPIESVYNKIVTQDGLSAWWTPGAAAKRERGSTARFGFGSDYFKEMKIMTLAPPAHVEWVCTAGADEWIGTRLSFQLVATNKAILKSDYPEMSG